MVSDNLQFFAEHKSSLPQLVHQAFFIFLYWSTSWKIFFTNMAPGPERRQGSLCLNEDFTTTGVINEPVNGCKHSHPDSEQM